MGVFLGERMCRLRKQDIEGWEGNSRKQGLHVGVSASSAESWMEGVTQDADVPGAEVSKVTHAYTGV